jgi:hypothetical protein
MPVGADIALDEARSGERKVLREALELFTVLFKVDCSTFEELLARSFPEKTSSHQLIWGLWPVGVLAYHSKASLTWGDLLGFADDTWANSPEFLSAMHMLETMGAKQTVGASDELASLRLSWTCAFPASEIRGSQEGDKEKDSLRFFSRQLREVMGFGVPPIARLCAKQSGKLVESGTRKRPRLEANASTAATPALCQSLVAKDVDLAEAGAFTEIVAALASTPTEMFQMSLANRFVDDEDDNASDSPTIVANGGLLLNVLLRGRSLCFVAGHNRGYQTASVSVTKCNFSCSWVYDGEFAAVCSAIAELPGERVMEDLSFFAVCRGRWLWLVYMLCCGSSSLNLHNLKLVGASLTNADIASLSVMMQNRYPVVAREASAVRVSEYGVASIPEGAELQPTSNEVLISALAFRCRARYTSTSTPGWVEAVVPGYGICKTRVGDEVSCFDRDSSQLGTPTSRDCRLQSLKLHIASIELDTLVLGLLKHVGSGLRTLSMELDETLTDEYYDPNRRADLDLGKLAAVCPRLEVLELKYFDVVVLPCNDDALRDWPIKKMIAAGTDRFPDLAPYLENLEMQMARELVDITIHAPENEDFDEEKRKKLEGHDGDYLPLVKEKFPLQSKVAVLSVVASSSSSHRSVLETKAFNKLDANVLGCVFAFAATPGRRKVRIREW